MPLLERAPDLPIGGPLLLVGFVDPVWRFLLDLFRDTVGFMDCLDRDLDTLEMCLDFVFPCPFDFEKMLLHCVILSIILLFLLLCVLEAE